MISRMGEIYSRAYCTVIAAAGKDAQTGLPGVSKTHPRRQQKASIKGVTLLESYYSSYHGADLLSSSNWARRGWTYQECYLSTRRLIFTEHGLMYLCNRQYAAEPFKNKVDMAGEDKNRSFASFMPYLTLSGLQAGAGNLRKQIQEYTRRDLTFPEDSINAFLGVLDHASRTERAMAHLWGLPLYENQPEAPQPRDMLFDLFWWHEAPGNRRHGFPSWTWAGWAGPVRFQTHDKYPSASNPPELCLHPPDHPQGRNILVMSDDGDHTLCEYAQAFLKKTKTEEFLLSHLGPTRLLVSCYVLPLRLQHFHLSEDQVKNGYTLTLAYASSNSADDWERAPNHQSGGCLAVVQVRSGVYLCIRPLLDLEAEQWDNCFALHFVCASKSWGLPTCEFSILVVRRMDNGMFERVGLIHWRFYDFDQPMFFVDEEANFTERVVLPAEEDLFCTVAQKQTICLV